MKPDRFASILMGMEETGLERRLRALTRPGELLDPDAGKIRCVACGHRCLIGEGQEGICRVRFVEDGELRVPFGYVGVAERRPDREEAVLPRHAGGARRSRSGCSAATTSAPTARTGRSARSMRDPESDGLVDAPARRSRRGARPARATRGADDGHLDLQRAAHHLGMGRGRLPRGARGGADDELRLERQRHARGARLPPRPGSTPTRSTSRGCARTGYRKLGGRLSDGPRRRSGRSSARGIWVEVVTLVVPGLNDSDEELRDAARFLAALAPTSPGTSRRSTTTTGWTGTARRPAAGAPPGRGDRARGGAALRLRREPPGTASASGRTPAVPAARTVRRRAERLPAFVGSHRGAAAGGVVPGLPGASDARDLVAAVRTPSVDGRRQGLALAIRVRLRGGTLELTDETVRRRRPEEAASLRPPPRSGRVRDARRRGTRMAPPGGPGRAE